MKNVNDSVLVAELCFFGMSVIAAVGFVVWVVVGVAA